MPTPNELRTLLASTRQAILDRNYTMALDYIEQAQALVPMPDEPPEFDPTKPYHTGGVWFGIPQGANNEE